MDDSPITKQDEMLIMGGRHKGGPCNLELDHEDCVVLVSEG